MTLLTKRFNPENLYYLTGTKSFHHFVPISCDKIGVKRVSTDTNFEFTFNFKSGTFGEGEVSNNEVVVNGGEYVVCMYGTKLWIGVVISVDETERDCLIRFMHPSLPSNSFFWPSVDECHVPLNKIFLEIDALVSTSSSGRNYFIHPDDI